MNSPATLPEWLHFIQSRHPRTIDLGLERVSAVYRRLGSPAPAPLVITVAGTNGKGSCVALLDSILRAAGQRVGAYTSPHLLRFNERVRIDGRDSSDRQWCDALGRVERARGGETLTYFEFATLAAMLILASAGVEVAVLEVGLGGRLDAVNAIPADAALISSIDLDHADWLGTDRASIAREKAGIFRPGKPALCGQREPPAVVRERAAAVGARYLEAGRDFDFEAEPESWTWCGPGATRSGLPWPGLRGRFQLENTSLCLAALAALERLDRIDDAALHRGLRDARLAGRMQQIREAPAVIVDVAHNPAAARAVAAWLEESPARGRLRAVLGMLKTKDAAGFMAPLAPLVYRWYLCSLPVEQGASAAELSARRPPGSRLGGLFDRVEHALERALRDGAPQDRVLVVGSFHTAAAALMHLADPALSAGGRRDRADVSV